MNPVVAVIAPGMMGAAVGGRLVERGLKVLTSLKGRSADSATRARHAGLTDAGDDEIAAADFILSIVPPSEAVPLASRMAPALAASNSKPIYVDCNAISPPTVDRVAAVTTSTGCSFVGLGLRWRPDDAGVAFHDAERVRTGRPRAGRAAERGLGVENVLRRHHQGNAGTRRRHDTGGGPRRLGRCTVRRTAGEPAADAGVAATLIVDHATESLSLGARDA